MAGRTKKTSEDALGSDCRWFLHYWPGETRFLRRALLAYGIAAIVRSIEFPQKTTTLTHEVRVQFPARTHDLKALFYSSV